MKNRSGHSGDDETQRLIEDQDKDASHDQAHQDLKCNISADLLQTIFSTFALLLLQESMRQINLFFLTRMKDNTEVIDGFGMANSIISIVPVAMATFMSRQM